jgi:hypothetical protein
MQRIPMTFVLLMTFSATLCAQTKPVCSLLTASDVAALGATGQGIPGEMPMTTGPAKVTP